ncbi:DUF2953 domain-containing protein [Alkaliphilus transvaalensis]|uniref:DUF2953 domain-containing protein n=1 Tax=Alkaliphilus transvaalensis TaxID=114628 RepID=UPI000479C319|nr:DUF2953 domain-containing protein [Alkaliphilus transvaalensis]
MLYTIIYIILTLGFIFIIVFAFSELNVAILVLKNSSREEIVIDIKLLYGLLKYRIELPFVEALKKGNIINDFNLNSDIEIGKQEIIKDNKERDFSLHEIKRIYHQFRLTYIKYKKILNYINSRIIFEEVCWDTEVGTGDAAVTAIATGSFWVIKTNLASFAKKKLKLKEMWVNVRPYYEGEKFTTSFNCIFTLKIGYIIIAAIKTIYRKIRGW